MIEFFIALRHIKERKFQSVFSILSVAIAIVVFTVSLTVSNGLEKNMINSLLTLSPEISIKNIDSTPMGNYGKTIEKLKQNKDIESVTPKISDHGIIQTQKYSKGILVDGINGDDLKNNIKLKIIEGTKDISELNSVLIGEELQKNMGIKINDEINFVTSGNASIQLRVKGVFKTGFLQYDSNLIIVPLETMQLLAGRGEVITEIFVKTKSPEKAELVQADIWNMLIEDGMVVHTWKDMNQSLLSAVKFEKFILVTILSLLLLIASFAVSIILNMIVREKIKDIGILKSLGYTNKNIKNIFLIEGLLIGIFGMMLASIISPIILVLLKKLFLVYIKNSFYYLDELPLYISGKEILWIYGGALVIVFASTIRPAIRASRLKPVEALKHE